MDIFTIKNLTFCYAGAAQKVLEECSFSVGKGEFILLSGYSGSGKTTLLRLMKPVIAPVGECSGAVLFYGKPIKEIPEAQQVMEIGYVGQNPHRQFVTDSVWHELAFGLESLGVESSEIRRRVAEMASFFGLENEMKKQPDILSGGRKQVANLAAVMIQRPAVLLLDEPTAQLDPIAAEEFLQLIYKINREFGTTVLLCEQKLELVASFADRLLVLDKGRMVCDKPPQAAAVYLHDTKSEMVKALPAATILSLELNAKPVALTVREGHELLGSLFSQQVMQGEISVEKQVQKKAVLQFYDVWFRYEKNEPDVVKGLDFSLYEQEIFCLMGGNGEGKTTVISLACKENEPYAGKIKLFGKSLASYTEPELFGGLIGVLPQNLEFLFTADTLREDFMMAGTESEIEKLAKRFDIFNLLSRHPFDLSSGELQRAALVKILLHNPKVLLLDEPTQGLDAKLKQQLGALLRELCVAGCTIMMVSHDIEFAACYATRCGLLFDGELVSTQDTHAFFARNNFYTTAARRVSQSFFSNAITTEEVLELCLQNKACEKEQLG